MSGNKGSHKKGLRGLDARVVAKKAKLQAVNERIAKMRRDSETAATVTARCGRTDPHGGHWIGRQPSGAPFCVGNVGVIITAQPVEPRAVITSGPLAGREVRVIDNDADAYVVVTFDNETGEPVRRSVSRDAIQLEPTIGPDSHYVER